MGKLLSKKSQLNSIWPHYFSLGRCHLVLLGLGLFPGSSEKEQLTQQVLIWLSLLFSRCLSFKTISWFSLQHCKHMKPAGSNAYWHLLYDKNTGWVFTDFSSVLSPYLLCIPLSKFYLFILLSQILCTPSPLKLTHTNTCTLFFLNKIHLNLTFQASYSMTPCLFASLWSNTPSALWGRYVVRRHTCRGILPVVLCKAVRQ